MARKGYGRNNTLVNITTHADDGTSPVGSNEWNENPKKDGIFGLTKSAQAISSNDIDVTDSYIEVTNTGDIYTLSSVTTSLSSTNYASDSASSISEGDLIYVVKASGVGTVNLKHQNGGAGAGKITTLTAGDKALSATVPTILMARTISSALEWVEYGGGAVADASITNTKLAVMAANTIKVRNANSSGAPSDIALATTQILIGNGTGFTAAALSGDVAMDNAGAVTVGTLNQSTTGSAATLTTPRAIGGVNFNGSAPIDLPGVNVAGNQATSGLAATATLAVESTTVTCADNAANVTVYPTFVDGATGAQDLETDTGLNYNPSTGLLSAVGLTLSGDLTVNGTNTIINSTTLTVDDKNIEMGSVATPSDTTANGGGITLKGATDKTILWDNANDNFTSNQDWNIPTGKVFKINNASTLSATALGSAVLASSLTSVGAISAGSWVSSTPVASAYLDADTQHLSVAQTVTGKKTFGAAGAVGKLAVAGTTSGSTIIDATAAAGSGTVTLPTTGTLATTGGTETLTAKTLTSPVINVTSDATGDIYYRNASGVFTRLAKPASPAGEVLTFASSATAPSWAAAAGGGATILHDYTIQASTYTGGAASGTTRSVFIRTIDSNNEGVFVKIKKNGTVDTEVQIA